MSAAIYHSPISVYCPPIVSRFASTAELDDLRRTRRQDRDIAARAASPSIRMKAQARVDRLAELEERGL